MVNVALLAKSILFFTFFFNADFQEGGHPAPWTRP